MLVRSARGPTNQSSILKKSSNISKFSSHKSQYISLSVSNNTSLNMSLRSEQNPVHEAVRSTKLWFDVPSNKEPLIYHSSYNIEFLGLENLHPFDSTKWGRILRFLETDGVVQQNQIVKPKEATEEDLLVVHSREYLGKLKKSINVASITELPPVALLPNFIVQRRLLHPFRLQVGGTVLGAKLAMERGWSINLGGGFHHASGGSGGGFCAYADISLAAKFALEGLGLQRVMIVDLDAHQGNGHERDFTNDDRVYIFDMYNADIYPLDKVAKRGISRKVELQSSTKTEQFLDTLSVNLEEMKTDFEPQLIIYNAGTDVLVGDPLGKLKVSADGVAVRDEMVFKFAKDISCPILMVTSGGYQNNNARIIADSIGNLASKEFITLKPPMTSK